MTPNDLYSECAPTRRGRTPQEKMFFPLTERRPNRFLAIPRGTQSRRGNRGMLAASRTKALMKRLGL